MSTTCIRNASWVVAWDESEGEHRYLCDGDVVFSGDTINFVGKNYTGSADTEIDGKDLVILPGFVDIHAHPALEPINKGIREEHGVPEMYMIGLYERMQAFVPDPQGMLAAAEVAYAELLKSGVTTVVDLMFPFDGWLDLLQRSGLRGYAGPWYGAARWKIENRHELNFIWDEDAGRRDFRSAIETIEKLEKDDPSGLMKGILCGGTIETMTEELIHDSIAYAADTHTPFTTHGSQCVVEFLEMTKRHGISPIQWADSVGMLGPHTIVGHGLMIDAHSWIRWHTTRDLDILAATGTSVAHCPTPFSRYGQVMEDFGRYVRAGVNMGMGTDTFPPQHDRGNPRRRRARTNRGARYQYAAGQRRVRSSDRRRCQRAGTRRPRAADAGGESRHRGGRWPSCRYAAAARSAAQLDLLGGRSCG